MYEGILLGHLNKALEERNEDALGDLGDGVIITGMRQLMGGSVYLKDFGSLNASLSGQKGLVALAREVDNPTDLKHLYPLGFFTKLLLSACVDEILLTEERLHLEDSPPPMLDYLMRMTQVAMSNLSRTRVVTVGMVALVNAVHFQTYQLHNHLSEMRSLYDQRGGPYQ